MLVIGIALLLGAAVLAPLAFRALRRWSSHTALSAVRPRALAALAGREVQVSGVAVPGPDGAIESRLARAECVWHGHEVNRHYWSLADAAPASGERTRERACDSIADYASDEPFGIIGEGAPAKGTPVLVAPEDAALSGVDMVLQRVVGRPQPGVPAQADDLLARVKGRISGLFRGETIEFEYREWVLRAGEPITVHGVVELRDGHPVLTAPPDGRLRIERGPAAEPARPAPRAVDAVLLGAGALATACTGVTLLLTAA
jgi:hypothetical protein